MFPLTVNDKRSDQPKKIKFPLYEHQKAILYKAEELERIRVINRKNIDLRRSTMIKYSGNIHIRTNAGIIGDSVGSGKTAITLSIISNNKMKMSDSIIPEKSYNSDLFRLELQNTQKTVKYIDSTLIVVPEHILNQWQMEIKKFTNLNTCNNITINNIFDNSIKYDIYLITYTHYRNLSKVSPKSRAKTPFLIKFKRIIFDEFDRPMGDIAVYGNFPLIMSEFTWFMSASYKDSKSNLGVLNIFNRIFKSNSYSPNPYSLNLIDFFAIRTNDEFREKSIKLPYYTIRIIKIKENKLTKIFRNILGQRIHRLLEIEEFDEVVKLIGAKIMTKDNIVKKYTKHLDDTIKKYNLIVSSMENSEIIDENIISQIERIKKQKHNYERKLRILKANISNVNGNCPISLEPMVNKCIVPCCETIFELINIIKWLTMHKTCPMCRTIIDESNLIKIKNKSSTNQSKLPIKNNEPKTRQESLNNLLFELSNQSSKKICIICFERSIIVEKTCGTNKFTYNIEEFKKTNKILILNKKFINGLNLPEITDMILYHSVNVEERKQCIGRAQRIGRKNQLTVYEFKSDIEINLDL